MKTLLPITATAVLCLAAHAAAPSSSVSAGGFAASCFDVTRDGTNGVHLLYGRPAVDGSIQLFHCGSDGSGGSWSQPVAIPMAHAPAASHHRGNDPQVAVSGNHILAIWTAKGGGPFGSGPIGVSLSSDGGKTWRPGRAPAVASEGEEKTGYRFPATAAGPDGFHLVWIHAAGTERSLRHSRLGFQSQAWSAPGVIDPVICACCWNVLKVDASGTLWVLYRDDEPRDLAVASSGDGGRTWSLRGSVGQFKWKFVGCPHVGGGLGFPGAAKSASEFLVSSVWTGHTAAGAAFALASRDGGKTWPQRVELTSGGAAGRHTDAAALSENHAAAVWDQVSPDGPSVHVRFTGDGGTTWSEPRRLSRPGRNSTYPRLIAGHQRYLVFWTEKDSSKQSFLRMEEIPLAATAR